MSGVETATETAVQRQGRAPIFGVSSAGTARSDRSTYRGPGATQNAVNVSYLVRSRCPSRCVTFTGMCTRDYYNTPRSRF
jgi:hypothetical protein